MCVMQSDDMCASPAKDFDFAPLNLHTFIMTDLVSAHFLLLACNKQHNLCQLIGLRRHSLPWSGTCCVYAGAWGMV